MPGRDCGDADPQLVFPWLVTEVVPGEPDEDGEDARSVFIGVEPRADLGHSGWDVQSLVMHECPFGGKDVGDALGTFIPFREPGGLGRFLA